MRTPSMDYRKDQLFVNCNIFSSLRCIVVEFTCTEGGNFAHAKCFRKAVRALTCSQETKWILHLSRIIFPLLKKIMKIFNRPTKRFACIRKRIESSKVHCWIRPRKFTTQSHRDMTHGSLATIINNNNRTLFRRKATIFSQISPENEGNSPNRRDESIHSARTKREKIFATYDSQILSVWK